VVVSLDGSALVRLAPEKALPWIIGFGNRGSITFGVGN